MTRTLQWLRAFADFTCLTLGAVHSSRIKCSDRLLGFPELLDQLSLVKVLKEPVDDPPAHRPLVNGVTPIHGTYLPIFELPFLICSKWD